MAVNTELETQLRETQPEPGPAALGTEKQAASRRRQAMFLSIAGAVGLLVAWSIASVATETEFQLLPPPWEVADRMWGFIVGDPARGVEGGTVFVNFWDTSARRFTASSGGRRRDPDRVLMGRYRYAKNYFFDFVYLSRTSR